MQAFYTEAILISEQNVEATRRILDAAERRDYQAVLVDLDRGIEIDDKDIIDADDYRGHDSFIRWMARWSESWDSWRLQNTEIRSVGEDYVVALFVLVVRGKGSGIELERRDALVCKFQSAKVVQMGYYNDQQQALEAAGLSE